MHQKTEPFRVFLLEDSPVIRESLIEHIEEMAPALVIAWEHSETPSTAWLHENSLGWDVAVLDIFITKGTGLGVAESLQDRSKGQRVVVLSNYATDDMRARCLALGVDAIFDKSNELEEFTDFMLDFAAQGKTS